MAQSPCSLPPYAPSTRMSLAPGMRSRTLCLHGCGHVLSGPFNCSPHEHQSTVKVLGIYLAQQCQTCVVKECESTITNDGFLATQLREIIIQNPDAPGWRRDLKDAETEVSRAKSRLPNAKSMQELTATQGWTLAVCEMPKDLWQRVEWVPQLGIPEGYAVVRVGGVGAERRFLTREQDEVEQKTVVSRGRPTVGRIQ